MNWSHVNRFENWAFLDVLGSFVIVSSLLRGVRERTTGLDSPPTSAALGGS